MNKITLADTALNRRANLLHSIATVTSHYTNTSLRPFQPLWNCIRWGSYHMPDSSLCDFHCFSKGCDCFSIIIWLISVLPGSQKVDFSSWTDGQDAAADPCAQLGAIGCHWTFWWPPHLPCSQLQRLKRHAIWSRWWTLSQRRGHLESAPLQWSKARRDEPKTQALMKSVVFRVLDTVCHTCYHSPWSRPGVCFSTSWGRGNLLRFFLKRWITRKAN